MADYLSKLPLEVSNEIYKELLVDTADCIELQKIYPSAGRLKKKLHTNILRASKLVYVQASTVLYGQNRFRFLYPKVCVKRGGTSLFSLQRRPQNGAFDRIKHVSKQVVARTDTKDKLFSHSYTDSRNHQIEIVFQSRAHCHICPDAEEIMAVVEFIKNSRCSLKNLRLAFTFQEVLTYGLIVYYDEPDPKACTLSTACTIASSPVLINAVSNLQVENQIEIVISSDDENCLVPFGDFAAQIGSQKQWATVRQNTTREIKVDEESSKEGKSDADSRSEAIESSSEGKYHEHNRYCRWHSCDSVCSDSESEPEPDPPSYTWAWTLTPAAEATKESIPENDRA